MFLSILSGKLIIKAQKDPNSVIIREGISVKLLILPPILIDHIIIIIPATKPVKGNIFFFIADDLLLYPN